MKYCNAQWTLHIAFEGHLLPNSRLQKGSFFPLADDVIVNDLLGTPDTSFRGLRTLKVLRVFKLILSSDPAGRIIGKKLKQRQKNTYNSELNLILTLSPLSQFMEKFKVR